MSAIDTIWLVRDPTPRSELGDVVWEQRIETLDRYIHGCPRDAWQQERHTAYTSKDEAISDALRRLARMDPEREGWHMAAAYSEFGYGVAP